MVDIEQIKTNEEILRELGDKQYVSAKKYYKERVMYAELHTWLQIELATRMNKYRKERSSIGYETALLRRLEDAINEGDNDFIINYKEHDLCLAKYKSLDRALESLQNQAIGVQSIMKQMGNSERFGKPDNG